MKAKTSCPEVTHKNCSKLEERMKFGTKMRQGMEKSNWLGAMRKSILKVMSGGGGILVFTPCVCLQRRKCQSLHFEFMK